MKPQNKIFKKIQNGRLTAILDVFTENAISNYLTDFNEI